MGRVLCLVSKGSKNGLYSSRNVDGYGGFRCHYRIGAGDRYRSRRDCRLFAVQAFHQGLILGRSPVWGRSSYAIFWIFNRGLGRCRGGSLMASIFLSRLRLKLACLIVSLLVQFTIVPIRQANAIVPLVVGAGLLVAETSTGAAFMTSLALHASILAVGFYAASSSTPSSGSAGKVVDVKLNPKAALDTPAGWTAPVSPAVEPTAPASIVATSAYRNNNLGGPNGTLANTQCPASTKAECLQWHQDNKTYKQNGGTAVNNFTYGGETASFPANQEMVAITNSNNAIMAFQPDGSYYVGAFVTAYSCPAGYTVSGSNCNKSDENAVKKPTDGKCQIKRVGNVVSYDTRDPDCDNGVVPAGVTITTDTVTVASDDGYRSTTVKVNPDGSSTITENVSRQDGSGKTDRNITSVGVPNATTGVAEVTGFSSAVYSGIGTAASSTPDTATSGGGDAKDATLQAIKSQDASEYGKVDADRTAADTKAGQIASDLDNLKASGQDTVAALGLPTQSTYSVFDVGGVGAAMPSNAGDCVALDVSLPYLGNLHISPCSVVTAVRPLVDFLTVSLAVIAAIFAVLGRREESV